MIQIRSRKPCTHMPHMPDMLRDNLRENPCVIFFRFFFRHHGTSIWVWPQLDVSQVNTLQIDSSAVEGEAWWKDHDLAE